MGTFALDIQKFAIETKQDIDSAVRVVVKRLAEEVDKRSPVGNPDIWKYPNAPEGYIGGHFRINNQYKFGSIPDSEIDGTDASGSTAMAAVVAGIYSAPVAGVHYIANNVPYAQRLEDGWSGQTNHAPEGIYGLSMLTVIGGLHKFGFKV